MRFLVSALLMLASAAFGQTNTFPASGNVGVGTASPQAKLHVADGDILFQNTSSGYPTLRLKDVAGGNVLRLDYNSIIHAGGGLYLRSGGTSPMILNDTDGGNVGIGTASPGGKLDINYAGGQLRLSGGTVVGGLFTNATDLLHLADWNTATKGITINMSSGDVGIGTHTPDGKLHVSGTGTIISSVSSDAATTSRALLGLSRGSSYWHIGMNVNQAGTNDFQFRFAGGYHFTIQTGGNVGIGTTTPDAKLSVKGQVHAQEVRVDLNGAIAPDYVFNKDYKLPSLEEIKSYIEKNNHLPEVPSAKEMEENGVNLGEMNLLLLKKIEELTLHLLEQERTNIEQEKKIKRLERLQSGN